MCYRYLSGRMEKTSAQFEDDVARLVSRNKNGTHTSLVHTAEAAITEQKNTIQSVRSWLALAEGVPRDACIEETIFTRGAELRGEVQTHQDGMSLLKSRIVEAIKESLKSAS